MSDALRHKLVLVTRKSRLQELIARFNTVEQARFQVQRQGADFADYESEHAALVAAAQIAEQALARHGRVQRLDRSHLPRFLFSPDEPVVVLGQDGLVANTLKYLDGQPVIGVNPDPALWEGALLPFKPSDLDDLLPQFFAGRRASRSVCMAEASLADGQRLLAVNDFYIGAKSHVSSRYRIRVSGKEERQSSSGVIVSTGLGSTGWFRSVLAGSIGVSGREPPAALKALQEKGFGWDEPRLFYSVREPWPSRTTHAHLVFGELPEGQSLSLVSEMPENGVIFSDGLESDFLSFASGTEVRIGLAKRRGVLLI